MVTVNFEGAVSFYPHTPDRAAAQAAYDTLVRRSGAGNDFTGWLDLPVNYDKGEFARIQKAAQKIQSDSKALVVIGIGGSYLGARAVVELLKSPNYNALPKNTPDIYFAGNGISSDAVTEIFTMIGDRDFPSTSSPNPAQRPSPPSPSASSSRRLKRNTAQTAHAAASTPRPTGKRARSRRSPTARAMRRLSFPTMSAAAIPC